MAAYRDATELFWVGVIVLCAFGVWAVRLRTRSQIEAMAESTDESEE